VDETLYLTAGIPPTNEAPNGWYSDGTKTIEIDGTAGPGKITTVIPDGCS
jgi:hypothetical protein